MVHFWCAKWIGIKGMTAKVENIVLLQCRTTSTRLPGKCLLPLGGLPLVVLAARRATGLGNRVVLVTSDESSDDALAREATTHGIEVVRGSLTDVLGRFVVALGDAPDEALVTRLTGDNPVPDHRLIAEVVSEMEDRNLDYITTTHPESGLPYGVSVEITRVRHLREAARQSQSAFEREHVSPYVIDRYGATPFLGRRALNRSAYRMTIDCLDDYLSMHQVFDDVSDPVNIPWVDLVSRVERARHQPLSALPAKRFVMGTVQLGLNYGISGARTVQPSERQDMIKMAVGNGCEWLDTARAYGNSEQVIGNTLATGWAGRCRVITKLDPLTALTDSSTQDEWRLATDLSVMSSCVELRASHIDTLLLHRADHLTVGSGAVWQRLCELQDIGRVGHLGVSVQSPDELKQALSTPRVEHVQLPCNILDWRWKPVLAELENLRATSDLVVHVRSVFLQGLLLGGTEDDWRRAYVDDPAAVKGWLSQMVAQCGRQNEADLCLAWAQAQPWIDGIVVGTDNMAQLEQNLSLFRNPPLTQAQLALIDESRPALASNTLDPAHWASLGQWEVTDAAAV